MSIPTPVLNFQTEVKPYIYSIHLQFVSKRTKKIISAPSGASGIVRGFFANRGLRAATLDTFAPGYARWDSIHLLKTDKHPRVIRDPKILDGIISNKIRQIRLPWNFFQRNQFNIPSEEQINRFNYIVSGECNKDLKSLCAGFTWEVNCFLMAEISYSPEHNAYGYFHQNSQVCLAVIGTDGTMFNRFMTPDNVVIEKIIL
jgi:hypothetical protein